MCLKIENYFLKIFMKIRVNKKIVKKYVKIREILFKN